MNAPINYLVLNRREILSMLAVLDKDRPSHEMKMSDCVICEGQASVQPGDRIQLAQVKFRLP